MHDVIVCGGGPAGLAFALHATSLGLDVVVLERRTFPVDKACGEGVMPSGVASLKRLGVFERLTTADMSPFEGIRYVQEDGTTVEGRFQGAPGVGIRREALSRVLVETARIRGVRVREGTRVHSHEHIADTVRVHTSNGDVTGRLLVAADGLHSPLRAAEGLTVKRARIERFGVRRHLRRRGLNQPVSKLVEVHFAEGVEAYLTPSGDGRLGIAFLWDRRRLPQRVSWVSLLDSFPAVREQVADFEADSEVLGAGPLWQRARSRVADRFALLGDAAGYVDALTGEGISLSLAGAEALASVVPAALAAGASRESLLPYDRKAQREFATYERLASTVLNVARRPAVRRTLLRFLARVPSAFELGLRLSLGAGAQVEADPHIAVGSSMR